MQFTAHEMRIRDGKDAHRWFYFSNLTRDEVIIFKAFDSDAPEALCGTAARPRCRRRERSTPRRAACRDSRSSDAPGCSGPGMPRAPSSVRETPSLRVPPCGAPDDLRRERRHRPGKHQHAGRGTHEQAKAAAQAVVAAFRVRQRHGGCLGASPHYDGFRPEAWCRGEDLNLHGVAPTGT